MWLITLKAIRETFSWGQLLYKCHRELATRFCTPVLDKNCVNKVDHYSALVDWPLNRQGQASLHIMF